MTPLNSNLPQDDPRVLAAKAELTFFPCAKKKKPPMDEIVPMFSMSDFSVNKSCVAMCSLISVRTECVGSTLAV